VLEPGSLEQLLTVDGWVVVAYQFGPPLIRAVLLAIGTWIAVRLARSSFNFASRRADAHARILIGRVIDIIIIGLGVSTILDTVGVPLTTFVTVLGVAGLGISLAMQDVLKSFVAGTFLLFERPFRIGDEISIKGERGIVEHIGIRTTRLRNADNVQVIVPNGVVFAEIVANRTNEIKPPPAPAVETSADAADHESPPGSTPRVGTVPATSATGAPAAPAVPAAPVTPPSR
jgi:small conductance mechanosensitive channel